MGGAVGACVAREPAYVDPEERLLAKDDRDGSGGMWCVAPAKDGEGPFQHKVRFRRGVALDAEAKVVKGLMDVLWIENPRRTQTQATSSFSQPSASQTMVLQCASSLKALMATQTDAVLDFVVPVLNVVLHAPCQDCRQTLWESFVLEAARKDPALSHLFYWALTAVETSPQAEEGVKADARKRMVTIQGIIRAEAQLKQVLSELSKANEAAKTGRPIPQVNKIDPSLVSPLVDVCQRLHSIGEEIVKVADREQRLGVLQKLVDEEINQRCKDGTPVPVQMLAPHVGPKKPAAGATASLLKVTRTEARVLSSKARAPYLCCLEVDGVDPGPDSEGSGRGLLGRLLCGSRKGKQPGAAQLNGASGRNRSARNGKDSRPKGAFGDETWSEVTERVRKSSEYGSRPNWSMIPLIVKSNADDVRQEELAYRLLKWFSRVFKRYHSQLWLQPFLIVATRFDGGVLEVVSNAISVSDLKKSYGESWVSLDSYFVDAFPAQAAPRENGQKSISLSTAKMNFIHSMAAYSVVCYVLAIRDRHNGNIMLDDEGHVLHVDFGFMLCGAPGGKALQKMGGFEHSDGFKLTEELVQVIGARHSREFKVFAEAVAEGMMAVRAHAEELLGLLQLSMLGSENNLMNCFCHPRGYPEAVLEDVCERLRLPGGHSAKHMPDQEFRDMVARMIDDSIDHWRSRLYDAYQYHFVGVH